MQTFPSSCSPERLRILQRIFDVVWLKVRTSGHPSTVAVRDEIARRVATYVNDVNPRPDEIAQAVIKSLGVNKPPVGRRPTFLLL